MLVAALMPTTALARKEPPHEKIEAGQTVLLLSLIESKPFHRHVDGWIARRLDGNDALIDQIRSRFADVLTDAGYKTAWETVPEEYVEPFQKWSYIGGGWSSRKVKPKYLPWFREQMQKHGATSVVVFYTIHDHSFGILSGKGDPPANAYLVANIGAAALHGEGLDLHSHYSNQTCRIKIGFSSLGVATPDQVTGSHVVPFNEMIAALAARNAAEYLANTGLYGISQPPCAGD